MDIKQVRTLVDVLDAGSFAAAAARTYAAPSTLSRQVASLERTLHVRLLERTGARLTLTREGVVLHAHLLAVVAAVQQAETAARGLRRPAVATPTDRARERVVPLLPPQPTVGEVMPTAFVPAQPTGTGPLLAGHRPAAS